MATSSLEKFKTALNTYGTSRDNDFVVYFSLPNALTTINRDGENTDVISADELNFGESLKLLQFYCDSVTIPPRNILTSSVRLEHATWEHPYGISYEPVSCQFLIDKNFYTRDMFVKWMNLIHSPQNNGLSFMSDMVTTITIIPLNKELSSIEYDIDKKYYSDPLNLNPEYKIHLIEAYPKSISNVNLSWGNQGDVAKFSVEFVYTKIIEGDFVSSTGTR